MTVLDAPHAQVVWHELECGGYRQDLALWRELAARHGGPVLEIGAGTGRVALDLARAGHRVTALERDAVLASELERRTHELPVTTTRADARSFDLDDRFALCIVPMQTIQLLDGTNGRAEFLQCARRHLLSGGVLAVAIVETLRLFRTDPTAPSLSAETCERGGVQYSSRPTAILADRTGFVLQRRREIVTAAGTRATIDDSVRIDRLTCLGLEAEAIAVGLQPESRRSVPATAAHTGSSVVILRA